MIEIPETIQDLIHIQVGTRTAVIVPEKGVRVTYDPLQRQLREMASTLAGSRIGRGDRVAIVLLDGLPALVSFLGECPVGTAAPPESCLPPPVKSTTAGRSSWPVGVPCCFGKRTIAIPQQFRRIREINTARHTLWT